MRSRATLAVFVLACLSLAAQTVRRVVSPFTWTEDFEGEGLGQFAGYPPVQDVGYDPSLSPTSEFGSPGGRALMRVVKPTRSGELRFGFIRRLELLSAVDGRLAFDYRLDYHGTGDRLEIGIAGADGKRYTASVVMGPGTGWRTAQIPMTSFVNQDGGAIPAGTGIEAVFLVAHLDHADADITYRFLIDNLSLEAARDLQFDVRMPRVVSIAHWPEFFSTGSIAAGEPVAIEAAVGLPLTTAECVAMDQDGRTLGATPLHKTGDNVWSGNLAARPAGVYTLELRGTAADGRTMATRVRILVTPSRSAAHPRLLFGAEGRARLVARTRDPKYAAIWHGLEERAKAARNLGTLARRPDPFALFDPVNLLPTLPGYFDTVSKTGAAMEFNALDAYLTDSGEARTAAKSALLAVAHWNSWAPPWFRAHGQQTYYPAGQLSIQMAFAYDLLYHDLTPDERELVRQSLLEYGIAHTYREYVVDNRILANTSNWLGHTVGGALVAAAAIEGDGPAPQLTGYTNGLLRKFEDHLAASYLADGSYGEGISYQEFDLESTSLALTALDRVLGLNYWDRSHVKDSLWYAISTSGGSVRGGLDMGDSHPPGGQSIAPVVAQSGNPVFRWYYDHFEHRSLLDFFFADFSMASQAPPPGGSRYFPEKGNVVFRTGWDNDDEVLLFRAGPNFNHNHADQGQFLFRALGETLVTEAGYSDYYKDPYYDSYFKQAIGHNTVLLNGDPESQEIADTAQFAALDRFPKITDVMLSPSVDAVSSQLQQVYRNRLRSYIRRIVFVKPDYFLVYDDLAASQGPAEFDWLLHVASHDRVTTEGATSLYRGNRAVLAIQRLSPSDASIRVDEGHLPFSVFNPVAPPVAPPQPGILKLATNAATGHTHFLVALSAVRTEQAARTWTSGLHTVEDPQWVGVESRARRQDLVLFRKEESQHEAAYGDWSTDAAVWMVRREENRDTLLAGETVSILKRGGHILFACDHPASFAAEYRGSGIALTVNAPAPVRVKIALPNGELADIAIAAGRHELTVDR